MWNRIVRRSKCYFSCFEANETERRHLSGARSAAKFTTCETTPTWRTKRAMRDDCRLLNALDAPQQNASASPKRSHNGDIKGPPRSIYYRFKLVSCFHNELWMHISNDAILTNIPRPSNVALNDLYEENKNSVGVGGTLSNNRKILR